jgi:hypothetical protein
MRTSGWNSAMACSLFIIWLATQAFQWVWNDARFCVFLIVRKSSNVNPQATTTSVNVHSTNYRLAAFVTSISCYRSLFLGTQLFSTLSSCGSLSFATLRLVNWDMISHKSTDTISRKIFDYSFLKKCLYLSLFPSTVSMSAVLRRRRAKKYLRYSRLQIPQRLTFRA